MIKREKKRMFFADWSFLLYRSTSTNNNCGERVVRSHNVYVGERMLSWQNCDIFLRPRMKGVDIIEVSFHGKQPVLKKDTEGSSGFHY